MFQSPDQFIAMTIKCFGPSDQWWPSTPPSVTRAGRSRPYASWAFGAPYLSRARDTNREAHVRGTDASPDYPDSSPSSPQSSHKWVPKGSNHEYGNSRVQFPTSTVLILNFLMLQSHVMRQKIILVNCIKLTILWIMVSVKCMEVSFFWLIYMMYL